MIKVHELSDSAAFINGSKTQKPFTTTAFKGQTINEYIDSVSSKLAFVPSTYGLVKNYTLVYNPDVAILGGVLATVMIVGAIQLARTARQRRRDRRRARRQQDE
jgi:hypothetical protein